MSNKPNTPFLNRTLLYNSDNKYNCISEYYLHIFFRRVNIQSLETIKSIVVNFNAQRSKKSETEDFICLNKRSIRSFEFDKDDKDYYIETLNCVMCKATMKNFTSLLLHYKINHSEFLFFNVKIDNPITFLKEGHIVAFNKKENKEDFNEMVSLGVNTDTGYFCFFTNEKDRQYYLIEYLKETKDFDKLIHSEDLKEISKQESFSCYNKKNLTNSNKAQFCQYLPNPSSYMKDRHIFFDNFTGEILDLNLESAGHEIIEPEKIVQLEDKWIDDHLNDVSNKDKDFMKIWNRFTEKNKGNVCRNNAANLCKLFITENKDKLSLYYNSFLLHVMTLIDYELLNKQYALEILLFASQMIKK